MFTTATMESKKLQQLQQANSHLAPMPQTKAPSYQMATGGSGGGVNDYRQTRSPVFHNHPQYQSLASNFAQINLTNHQNPMMGGVGVQQPQQSQQHQHQQQSQQQQQHSSEHLHNKNLQNLNTTLLNSSDRLGYATTPQQQQPHSQLSHNLAHYHGEQIYQSNSLERERLYQQAPLRTHYPNTHSHVHPTTRLQQQYQLLQQEKMQQQLKTQNDAYVQQQQTFALRQQLNPPLPSQSHYHLQSQQQTPVHIPAQLQQQQQQQVQQLSQQQQQQQQLQQHQQQAQQLSQQQQQLQLQQQQQQQQHHHSRNVPPSSLNLTNHFQPAAGPIQMKNNEQQQSTQQHQQSQYATANPLHQHAAVSQNLLQNARLQQSQAIYQQNQQIQQQIIHKQMQQQSPQSNQIIIQQNNPGQVVNQACQTQIAGVTSSQKTSKSTNSASTPSGHQPLERKKSEPIHALKSPVTKRHPSAPVTLSGWLYKQGSEGLKVWRKRWFVLSDYCLFYYKSQEEEKLLGSVLLPSYRISACLPEDKVVRKFAFKCEHTNMRTYWLAAETAESMIQWVRALTLATMMQGSSESESQPSPSSMNENSDSGIHTFQSQQSKLSVPVGPLTPASDGGGGSNGGVQPLYANAPPKPRRATDGGYSSPSPENSIEKYDGHYDLHMQRQQQQQHNLSHQQAKSPIPPSDPIYESRQKAVMNDMRQNLKTPDPSTALRIQQMRIDNNKSPHVARQNTKSPYPPENHYVQEPMRNGPSNSNQIYPNEQYQVNRENIIRAPQKFTDDYNQSIYGEKITDRERELYLQKMLIQQQQQQQVQQLQQQQQQQRYTPSMSNTLPFNYQSAERRTPDTYGPPRQGQERRNFSDYEDIYNLAAQTNQQIDAGTYRRPMSPVRYNNNTQIPNMPMRYTPNYMEVKIKSGLTEVSIRYKINLINS